MSNLVRWAVALSSLALTLGACSSDDGEPAPGSAGSAGASMAGAAGNGGGGAAGKAGAGASGKGGAGASGTSGSGGTAGISGAGGAGAGGAGAGGTAGDGGTAGVAGGAGAGGLAGSGGVGAAGGGAGGTSGAGAGGGGAGNAGAGGAGNGGAGNGGAGNGGAGNGGAGNGGAGNGGAGNGGAGNAGAGNGGAGNAGAGNAGAGNGGAGNGGAGSGGVGGNCGVTTPLPFVPLSTDAPVAGTRAEGPLTPSCTALTNASSGGTLSFAINASSCVLTYTESPGGRAWTSTLPGAPTFDGTDYVCSYQHTGYVPAILGPCPEFGNYKNGLAADVKLTVSRATGAVTLHRSCVHIGVGCNPPNVTDATTTIDVGGTMACGG